MLHDFYSCRKLLKESQNVIWHIENLQVHYKSDKPEFWNRYCSIFFDVHRLQIQPLGWFESQLPFIRDKWEEIPQRLHGQILTPLFRFNLGSENARYLIEIGLTGLVQFDIDKPRSNTRTQKLINHCLNLAHAELYDLEEIWSILLPEVNEGISGQID